MNVKWIIGMVAGSFGVLLGVAAQLYAQSTAIYACVNSSSGEVKIVTEGTACDGNRTLVQWDIVGPPGPQGPQGPVGPQGPQGPAGAGARMEPMIFNVNCDAGDTIGLPPTIGGVTTNLIPGDTLLVSGTCNENVEIPEEMDRITLDGQGIATVNGPDSTQDTIEVRGRKISITGFTITGGFNGIGVTEGGTATIDGNAIQNTANNGISVDHSGFATIVNNTIQDNAHHGIALRAGSTNIGFRT